MARLTILLALLTALVSVHGQTPSTTVPASSLPTTVPASSLPPAPSTAMPAPSTPVPVPSFTATTSAAVLPTSLPIPDTEYALNYPKNKTIACLRFRARLSTEFNYTTTDNKTMRTELPVSKKAVIANTSFCNDTKALLVLAFTNNSETKPPHSLSFSFTANTAQGSQGWMFDDVTFNYTLNDKDFPGHDGTNGEVVTTMNAKDNSLFDDSIDHVEFERSYKCNSSETIMFNNTMTDGTNVTLHVSEMQVQVFQFKNTTGEFGNARTCPDDGNSTSKVVPIAVGAALAGLVVVVLIAYLIGRLRNRKQNSYEALS